MLNEHEWYAAPDETIESLAGLVLHIDDGDEFETRITGWELGIGNTTHLRRIESASVDDATDEAVILRELIHEQLDPYRHKQPTLTLVTRRSSTLPLLRDRLLVSDIDATFRGLNHISLAALVDQYFDSAWDPAPSAQDVTTGNQPAVPGISGDVTQTESLWASMNQIIPLVPRETVRGTRL